MGQAASAQNAMGLGSQAVIGDLEQTRKFMEETPLRCYAGSKEGVRA
jgi:hypothetical protein